MAITWVLLLFAEPKAVGYGAMSFIIVWGGLFEWLVPKKRRVFVVEDVAKNLDMGEAPGTFFFKVQPRRWIAVRADSWGDRRRIESDLREQFEDVGKWKHKDANLFWPWAKE